MMTAPCLLAVELSAHAARTPDRPAAWDRERSLTYAELDAAAARLAGLLSERRGDLGRCQVVPIVVGREVGSVVAIYASLRAGIAFTCLDADLPPAMIASILDRIDGPRMAIVSAPERAACLPPGVDVLQALGAGGTAIEPVPVDPTDLARVLFTSGSSGAPKGVMTTWDVVDSYLGNPLLSPPPGVPDFRALAPAPFGFAAGVLTAFRVALGVSISIVDPSAHDPVEFLEICDREQLSTIAVVPSLISAVMGRWPEGRRLESVRSLMTFGEPLEWSTVAAARRLLPPDAVVVNAYGATESGGLVVALAIDSQMPLGSGRVPLGRPLQTGRIRLESVFSEDPDAPRELVVRGAPLASGYWRDPVETAERFGREADGTMFWRSGDLVREDDDGLLHVAGRRDNVVKINGKLVEPSEPERVLGEQPGINRAVVLVQNAPGGRQRLVAHIEVAAGADPTPEGVRAALAARVAPHLVPAIFVRHDALPLTDRGKVDRRALMESDPVPWLEPSAPRPLHTFEVAAIDVVAGIVGHRSFGPDDDLWEVGLDSLGAAELLAALHDFGWPALPESVLLEHRSLSALNRLRATVLPTGGEIWLHADAPGAAVLCVLPPSSDALTFRRLARELAPDNVVGILRQFDPTATEATVGSVDEIADGLAASVAGRVAGRSVAVVGYSASGVVAHALATRLRDAGCSIRLVLLDAPPGASADGAQRAVAPALPRRLRTAARQAWLRALPPSTMPQRERAYARYESAAAAALRYEPTQNGVATVLFHARHGGMDGVVRAWSRAADDLTVVELDCDHFDILGPPYIEEVARWIRADTESPEA